MMASVSCKHFVRCDVQAVMQVQGAIESLKIVTGHLAAWNLPKYVHVTVEPFLRPHADYYSGAAFQVCTQSLHLPQSHQTCLAPALLYLLLWMCSSCSCYPMVQVNVVQPMTGASSLIAVGESYSPGCWKNTW